MPINPATGPATRLGYLPLHDNAPAWLRDVGRFLAIRSQFVLTGNIDDLLLMPSTHGDVPLPLKDGIVALLEVFGYDFLLCYDPFDYVRLCPADARTIAAASRATGLNLDEKGRAEVTPTALLNAMHRLVMPPPRPQQEDPPARGAVLIEHISRLGEEDTRRVFGRCLKMSHNAQPLETADRRARFNPVFWVVANANELPAWFCGRNERIRTQTIPVPEIGVRARAAPALLGGLRGYAAAPGPQRAQLSAEFSRSTDGLTLSAMQSTIMLAQDQRIPFDRVVDAVQLYKLGITDNPWNSSELHRTIGQAAEAIGERVKGQQAAIVKSIDILKRSVMGLSGAQVSARPSSGRPRGVLFFAGPTGVGKTELAKAITGVLFGDEGACIRFDMSEFAQEHAEARLIGAPPGFLGHDSGGELTNAVRRRPLSLILFDEIEKAHDRIWDKFLQILEDGRLTDGRGDTVYFSEAIIVFTSNLGSGGLDAEMPEAAVEKDVRDAISTFFRERLSRPEILNRLGDNIVVFQFITKSIAREIFELQLANVRKRVQQTLGITLEIGPEVQSALCDKCIDKLENGGRGIGNRLETLFVNPLARALFERRDKDPGVVEVIGLDETGGVHSVLIR